MPRWPIQRRWLVSEGDHPPYSLSTVELNRFDVVVTLGSAGLGKTFELDLLEEHEKSLGSKTSRSRLIELGATPDGLRSRLERLAQRSSQNEVLFFDTLDEALVREPLLGVELATWLREDAPSFQPRLRIACRAGVWPMHLQAQLEETFGHGNVALARLTPLTLDDIEIVARTVGVEHKAFLAAVEKSGAMTLAQQPLSLKMLLDDFKITGSFPTRRNELFKRAMYRLARDSTDRDDRGTASTLPIDELLEAAERLACLMIFSGREIVNISDQTTEDSLSSREIEQLPGHPARLSSQTLRAIRNSGLSDSTGIDTFKFVHRQFAEYFAGRRIATLLAHQALSLLTVDADSRERVAGPLREVAAFAAMESDEIAAWIADHDPEVIGRSDVADSSLRRAATLKLLEKFRRHELTDADVRERMLMFAGLQYEQPDSDLGKVLLERGTGCEDVLDCAIELVASWRLSSLADALATLTLDSTAPLQSRVAAAYALRKVGTPDAMQRLLPLIAGTDDDPNDDLKGLALTLNWPFAITVPQLLDALTDRGRQGYYGAFQGFISQLDHDGFDASGHLLEGLNWAIKIVPHRHDFESATKIAKRIARTALDHVDQPDIAATWARMLIAAAEISGRFTLESKSGDGNDSGSFPNVLASRPDCRRTVLKALASISNSKRKSWWAAIHVPGLLVIDDFPWLVTQACDDELPMHEREGFADLAKFLPWWDSARSVEAWLAGRSIEPLASRFREPLFVVLGSPEAEEMQRTYESFMRPTHPVSPDRTIDTAALINDTLGFCETRDSKFFINLCKQLTLEDSSTHLSFQRFIRLTPGWNSADLSVRQRIVDAAKRYLAGTMISASRLRRVPLRSILTGPFEAICLVAAEDPGWLSAQSDEWWTDRAWLILRELNFGLNDEPNDVKASLLAIVHGRAADAVRQSLLRLLRLRTGDATDMVIRLLDGMRSVPDAVLDTELTKALKWKRTSAPLVLHISRFLLARDRTQSLPKILALLDPKWTASHLEAAAGAAVAALETYEVSIWNSILARLRNQSELATRILGEFAHSDRFADLSKVSDTKRSDVFGDAQTVGELVRLLFLCFPPEDDPDYSAEARSLTAEDSARYLRNRLLSWLGDQGTSAAVTVLRQLEHDLGDRYPWLRRPRSRAERSLGVTDWHPFEPRTVAELLSADGKRLLRSGRDVLDGIVHALRSFEHALHHESPNVLEDLWNTANKDSPSPKEEEHISDKVCLVVRQYFEKFAIHAHREVQVFRRISSKEAGGAPGSNVDVYAYVPPIASTTGDAIKVPIEVKFSFNPDAKSSQQDQLVERYMSEAGTEFGVYALVWMGNPGPQQYAPKWESRESAIRELVLQAKDLCGKDGSLLQLRPIVIDAALPLAPTRKRTSNPHAKRTSKPRASDSAKSKSPSKRGRVTSAERR